MTTAGEEIEVHELQWLMCVFICFGVGSVLPRSARLVYPPPGLLFVSDATEMMVEVVCNYVIGYVA